MVKIAVCDDESYMADKIEEYIMRFANAHGYDFSISKFNGGKALLDAGNVFDLIFLDIQMDEIDGIETAKLIREKNMNVPIVYITSFSDYSMRAHKVHAFDFIEKPFDYSHIETVIRDFMKLNTSKKLNMVKFRTDDGDITQNADDILYFACCGQRKILMYTPNKTVELKGSIPDIIETINNRQFYMTHRNFIVNLKYVKTIVKKDYMIRMTNGDTVPFSQRKRIEFKERLHEYMNEHLVEL